MKKLLLIAAMAALALGASADGYKLEKVWELKNPQAVTGWDRYEIRQGFGMDGKFYVNCKKLVVDTIDGVPTVTTAPTIYEIDENGLTGKTFPGGKNCGIARDEAGNIVVSLTQFPNAWTEGLRVIDPATGNYVDHSIPPGAAVLGRCDFLGFAKGNMMEDGEIWLTGSTQGTAFSHIAIVDGEASEEDSYYMVGEGIVTTTSATIMPYTDLNGDDALLYWARNGNPEKISYNDDAFEATALTLANRANTNGMFPLVWDGKELFIYSTLVAPNVHYLDGFAIAESGQEPIVTVENTTTTVNGFQSQWLNAEVDANGVTIYQYFPGNDAGHFTVWRLTKDEPAPEYPKVYILGEVNDQGWAANAGTEMTYDPENNVYTATVTLDGRGESGENYFSFTTELANDNDEGGWAYIQQYRFGAVSEGDFWYSDQLAGWPLSLTYENGQAFRVMGGQYELTLDKENMKLYIEKVGVEALRGDVNGDGTVNVTDVTALINAVLNSDFNGIYFRNADVDYNGDITVTDITLLIGYNLNDSW